MSWCDSRQICCSRFGAQVIEIRGWREINRWMPPSAGTPTVAKSPSPVEVILFFQSLIFCVACCFFVHFLLSSWLRCFVVSVLFGISLFFPFVFGAVFIAFVRLLFPIVSWVSRCSSILTERRKNYGGQGFLVSQVKANWCCSFPSFFLFLLLHCLSFTLYPPPCFLSVKPALQQAPRFASWS